jgi:putative hemolysin
MLDVEHFVQARYPQLLVTRPLLAKPLLTALRLLFHEKEIRQFGANYPHLQGFDFVEQVLEYFDFSYRLRDRERHHIPARGRLVIAANHPIGSLDGLALLKLVREIRPDVKVVANDLLTAIEPLRPLLLPVDNMGGRTPRQNLRALREFLEAEGALIIFPAGEVSRFGAKGIRDGRWRTGFLRVAASARAPILPVFIDGRNSTFFYALSFLARPLSTLWLVREMFKQAKRCVDVRIGQPVSHRCYRHIELPAEAKAKLFRRHLYRIGNDRPGLFPGQTAIARPENRRDLRSEIRDCQLLGETADRKQIFLYRYRADSAVMREVGRLRELAFRAVEEGSGQRRDLDRFDPHYEHLLLWDEQEWEIAGAYRICPAGTGLPLYSRTLFEFTPGMNPYLAQGLELGRSFVQPGYWGKRSLDYLWHGIGAYLRDHPQYRYLFGPVSLSGAYPRAALELIAHFYQRHFPAWQSLAVPRNPFEISAERRAELDASYPGNSYREEFQRLKRELGEHQLSVPTLYKQYAELCDVGGVQFAAFNIDPAFGHCVDGLVIVDLARLKNSRRERYLG